MAAAVVVAGWGGVGGGCVYRSRVRAGSSREPSWGRGELGWRGPAIPSSGWTKGTSVQATISSDRGALGGSRGRGLGLCLGMTSLLEKVTMPDGALSPGPRDAEGQGLGRAPALGPRDSLASEDLELFVLALEPCDLWESARGPLSPTAGEPACE